MRHKKKAEDEAAEAERLRDKALEDQKKQKKITKKVKEIMLHYLKVLNYNKVKKVIYFL